MATEGSQRRAARLRVHVSDEKGRVLSPGLARWLAAVAPARARGAVNVSLVRDAVVRRLNRHYRGKDRATDVLSFPAGPQSIQRSRGTRRPEKPQSAQRPQSVEKLGRSNTSAAVPRKRQAGSVSSVDSVAPFLGDIVIARGVAQRQARAVGHGEQTEVRVLALHGLLHLLGYDHETEAGEMARVERRLRRKGGLREGLIERR
jgi:probable rRNA maturation factor